jgi:hypothetical protein
VDVEAVPAREPVDVSTQQSAKVAEQVPVDE